MSIQVGDVLRVVAILAWLDGDVAQNVFNAVIGGSGGPYDDDDIVADAKAWVNVMFANFSASMSDEIDGSEVRVYVYDSADDDWDEVGSDSWTFNPASANDQLPRGVAALINARTLDPDVSGKKYVMGMTEGAVDNGLINSGEIGRLILFGEDWTTAFTGGTSAADWVPGIWSVKETNFHPTTGSLSIPTIPAYQRRRKQGVGI